MKQQTLPWDPVEFLKTEADIQAYLAEASADGDPDLLEAVLKDIARARALWG